MDPGQMLQQAFETIRDHWLKALLPLLGIAIGWWWGRRHARREWSSKQFLSRVNVSLNTIKDTPGGRALRIRTLSEKDAKDVFLNQIAVEKMQAATLRTSEQSPLLPLGEDSWFLLNAVLNEISEQFALGHLRKDLGLPVTSGRYVIALTYEHDGAMRTRKVRAMVVQKQHLLRLAREGSAPPAADGPGDAATPASEAVYLFEHPNHERRLKTLRQLAAVYAREPGQFLEVELNV